MDGSAYSRRRPGVFVSFPQSRQPSVSFPLLAAAALVKDETDLVRSEDVNDQMRTNAMLSINNLRNGLGGRPDAATARSHATVLCVEFDLMAKNRSNTHTLWESLRNKGWYDLHRITPDYNGNYGHSAGMLQQRPPGSLRLTRQGKGHNPNEMRQLSTSSTA